MHPHATKNGYAKKRSGLIARGFTVRGWAMQNNFPVGSVYLALQGLRNGPKAVAIRRKLEEYING